MAYFMSETDRETCYVQAIRYINQARELNRQTAKLRANMGSTGKDFGTMKTQMEDLLGSAAALDALAQTELTGILDTAQPIVDGSSEAVTGITLNEAASPNPTATIVTTGASYTGYPTGGILQISGSTQGNNGSNYGVISRTAGVISFDTNVAYDQLVAADNLTLSPKLKLTWLQG